MNYFFLIVVAASMPALVTHEPVVPKHWTQSVEFGCPHQTLRIIGYGASRPESAQILLNGRPLQGPGADALRRDLSNRRAAYRIYARCTQGEPGIELVMYTGEKRADEVTYRSGAVLIVGNRLDQYRGLDKSDADSFWFR